MPPQQGGMKLPPPLGGMKLPPPLGGMKLPPPDGGVLKLPWVVLLLFIVGLLLAVQDCCQYFMKIASTLR